VRAGARVVEGSGVLSRPARERRVSSNLTPPVGSRSSDGERRGSARPVSSRQATRAVSPSGSRPTALPQGPHVFGHVHKGETHERAAS
jgi:hypothetical protein